MRLLIFLKSTKSLSFPFGFFCANIGLAYFENGRVVMMPYLCNMASSTKMSSFRFIGAGRLWLQAGESSSGVNFTLNSSFMPMSNLCRANISRNSTSNSSIFSFSSGVRVESFQSKFSRNFARDFSSLVGSSVSRSCKACSSRRIFSGWVCVPRGFQGFLRLGTSSFQKFEDFCSS